MDRQDQVEAPLQAKRGDEARLGEAAEDDRGGVSRKGSLPNRKSLYPQGSSRNGYWKAQEKVLVRVRARTGKGIAGGRVEAARAVWNSRRGLRQRSPSKSRLDHTKNEENKWGKVQFLFSTSLFPSYGSELPSLFAATSSINSQGLKGVQVLG